jgi:hypothetical protein
MVIIRRNPFSEPILSKTTETSPYSSLLVWSLDPSRQRDPIYRYHDDSIDLIRYHDDSIDLIRYHDDSIDPIRYHDDSIDLIRYHDDSIDPIR